MPTDKKPPLPPDLLHQGFALIGQLDHVKGEKNKQVLRDAIRDIYGAEVKKHARLGPLAASFIFIITAAMLTFCGYLVIHAFGVDHSYVPLLFLFLVLLSTALFLLVLAGHLSGEAFMRGITALFEKLSAKLAHLLKGHTDDEGQK